MHSFNQIKRITFILLIAAAATGLVGCSPFARDSGDPQYEAQTVVFEGLAKSAGADVSISEISVAELRKLTQHDLDASYIRTTGLEEKYKMSGPYLSDVLKHLGGNLDDYAGIGVIGSDGYYCLLSKEVINSTPDLMLAVKVDGKYKLDEEKAPVFLGVQGQFGPYWVKKVQKVMLYKKIPAKVITSVWVFNNLADGIEPYEYEYYGSKDDAIDLEQVFSRLDKVDNKAFFTMKSSDGFKKNEVINMVKSRYYIKVEGKDAPTNISPHIRLGMNVQKIAWISTNADAAIFSEEMMNYMDTVKISGQKGITLAEALYETEVKSVKTGTWDVLGTNGEKITVPGTDLNRGILVPQKDGKTAVIWDKGTGYKNIENLLRIRLVRKDASQANVNDAQVMLPNPEKTPVADGNTQIPDKPDADTVLSITGDGISHPQYWSLKELKSMKEAYQQQCVSTVNNYPTRKFFTAQGVKVEYLLKKAGLKSSARSIKIEASDGYKAELTSEQLLGKRYSYPALLKSSTENSVLVQPMLAWNFGEGKDLSRAKECELRLVIGQKGLNDVNTAPSVQKVTRIIVSSKDGGRWEKPAAQMSDGQITLVHDSLDRLKLYYTLDGSAPTEQSKVYNPSTTYFQPDLIKPIKVNGSGTLKVKAVGYGKKDSEVLTYAY